MSGFMFSSRFVWESQSGLRFIAWGVWGFPSTIGAMTRFAGTSEPPVLGIPPLAERKGADVKTNLPRVVFVLPALLCVCSIMQLLRALAQAPDPGFQGFAVLRKETADGPPLDEALLAKEHYVWETAVWICLSGRKLVKRTDGSCRLVPAAEVQLTDHVLPNELRPCEVAVRDDGIYEYRETNGPSNFSVYYGGNPRENEAALREALPALYLSFVSQPAQK
jgi:hypothetical protein